MKNYKHKACSDLIFDNNVDYDDDETVRARVKQFIFVEETVATSK